MRRWCFFLLLLLFLLHCVSPVVVAFIGEGIACQQFTDKGSVEDVCAYYFRTGPSPQYLENGTTVWIGNHIATYTILRLDPNNNITLERLDPTTILISSQGYMSSESSSATIQVVRDVTDTRCHVRINSTLCSDCEFCATDETATATTTTKISVDCSSIPKGRIVQCEPLVDIFYPLQIESRPQVATTPSTTFNPSSSSDEAFQPTISMILRFLLVFVMAIVIYFF